MSKYSAYAGRGKLALKVGYPAFPVTVTVGNRYTGTKNEGKVLTSVVDSFGNELVTDHVIAFGSKKLNSLKQGEKVEIVVSAYRYNSNGQTKIGLNVK